MPTKVCANSSGRFRDRGIKKNNDPFLWNKVASRLTNSLILLLLSQITCTAKKLYN